MKNNINDYKLDEVMKMLYCFSILNYKLKAEVFPDEHNLSDKIKKIFISEDIKGFEHLMKMEVNDLETYMHKCVKNFSEVNTRVFIYAVLAASNEKINIEDENYVSNYDFLIRNIKISSFEKVGLFSVVKKYDLKNFKFSSFFSFKINKNEFNVDIIDTFKNWEFKDCFNRENEWLSEVDWIDRKNQYKKLIEKNTLNISLQNYLFILSGVTDVDNKINVSYNYFFNKKEINDVFTKLKNKLNIVHSIKNISTHPLYSIDYSLKKISNFFNLSNIELFSEQDIKKIKKLDKNLLIKNIIKDEKNGGYTTFEFDVGLLEALNILKKTYSFEGVNLNKYQGIEANILFFNTGSGKLEKIFKSKKDLFSINLSKGLFNSFELLIVKRKIMFVFGKEMSKSEEVEAIEYVNFFCEVFLKTINNKNLDFMHHEYENLIASHNRQEMINDVADVKTKKKLIRKF